MEKYVYKDYDSSYNTIFDNEKKAMSKVLGRVSIEHVGSTAIKGLGGKGIIDIAVGVENDLKDYIEKLKSIGYEFREKASTDDRLFFRKDISNGKQRIHIHLTTFGGSDWKEMIAFRDYLLSNPGVVQQYITLKQKAVKEAQGNGEQYKKIKEPFVEKITELALQ